MSLDPARCCIRWHGMLTKKTTVLATLRRRALLRVAVSGNSHSTTHQDSAPVAPKSLTMNPHLCEPHSGTHNHTPGHSQRVHAGKLQLHRPLFMEIWYLHTVWTGSPHKRQPEVSTFGCTRRAYLQRERRLGRVAARLVRERLHEAVEGRHRAGDAPEGAAGALLI